MYVFKHDLLQYFLTDLFPKKKIDPKCLGRMREITKSIDSFRAAMGYKSGSSIPDLSWRVGWPTSADLALDLIEDMS